MTGINSRHNLLEKADVFLFFFLKYYQTSLFLTFFSRYLREPKVTLLCIPGRENIDHTPFYLPSVCLI